jgi:hypothetical protein
MTVVKTYYHRCAPAQPALALPLAEDDEKGEGVISAAIAVLIMAFIGVGMWFAFNATFQHTAKNVNKQVNCIGQAASSSNC